MTVQYILLILISQNSKIYEKNPIERHLDRHFSKYWFIFIILIFLEKNSLESQKLT